MNKTLLILFMLVFTCTITAQVKLKRDSFLLSGPFPKNYKELITDHKWKMIAEYSVAAKKFRYLEFEPRHLIFEDKNMYARIKGKKIHGKGELYLKQKIIFVSTSTLILEHRSPVKGGKRHRYFYRIAS